MNLVFEYFFARSIILLETKVSTNFFPFIFSLIFLILSIFYNFFNYQNLSSKITFFGLGIGDWNLGIGFWGLDFGDLTWGGMGIGDWGLLFLFNFFFPKKEVNNN